MFFRVLRLACLLLVALTLREADAAEPKRILMLHSFGRDFAPWNEYARHVRAELERQAEWPVDIYEASLAIARFGDEGVEIPFADYLRSLFADRRLDLVVTIGGPAAAFFQKYRQRVSPATPMLFTALEQRRIPFAALTPNDTAVAITIDFDAIIQNILRVQPETTNIVVVMGNSPIEKYWTGQVREGFQPYANRVNFTWLNELSFDEMLERAAALPPRSAIFFGLLSVDAAGVTHEEGKAVDRLHAVANAPMFTYVDAHFGRGVVGGPMIPVPEVGRRAASVAVRLLRGDEPGKIRLEPVGFAPPIFDWRELQRWNLSEKRLLPGEIRYRSPSLWDQYRTQVILTFLVLLFQSAMIGGLLIERHRRQSAELQSHQRFMEMARLDRALTASAMSASIAHELNQPLGAILSNSEAAEALLATNPLDLEQIKLILVDIQRDNRRAAEIIRHLRELLRKRPDRELKEIDLNSAIQSALRILAPEAAKRGIAVSASQPNNLLRVRAEQVHVEQVILNLALNGMDAMQNCAPGKRTLSIETAIVGDSQVEVSVADTGTGIPNDKLKNVFDAFYTTKQTGTGLGLSVARTIIETYRGRIWAVNRPSGGAIFRFSLPLDRA